MTYAAAIAGAAAVAGGAMNLASQKSQQGAAQDALSQQLTAQKGQQAIADKQLALATATRTDANGNKQIYIPGQGWIAVNSPATASQISDSNALKQKESIRQMVSGEPQRNRDAAVKVEQESAREPLLRTFEEGYGMPNKEGMAGRNKVAAATQATENAGRVSNAVSGAALRTGGSMQPYAVNMSGIEAGGTAGLRTALAKSDAEADPMFQAAMAQATDNKLKPYGEITNAMTGSSGATPTNADAAPDAANNNAAMIAAMKGGAGSEALYRGSAGLTPGLYGGAAQSPNYDLFTAGVGKLLSGFMSDKPKTNPNAISTMDQSQWTGGF